MKQVSELQHILNKAEEYGPEKVTQDLAYIRSLEHKYLDKVKLSAEEIKEMFNIHNQYWHLASYGYHCGSCRNKVYKTLMKIVLILQ